MSRLGQRAATLALMVVAAVALPFAVVGGPGRLLAVTAMLYGMLAVSWNLTLGFGGIFNFAHVGFFGAGGYALGIATVSWGWSPWAGLALAVVTGAVAGAVAYLPVVRMRGIYIALITFVFVQLCYYLVLAVPRLTGGPNGLTGVPPLTVGSLSLARYDGLGYVWLLAGAVVLLLVLLDAVLHSSFGRSLMALRDNEPLAASRGISRVRQQLLAFVLSGAVAGLTGGLYVAFFRVADVSLFSFGFVTLALSMIFLGGTGRTWGPLVGAVLVTVLEHRLSGAGAWRTIVIGTVTVLVLIFLPQGLAGLLDSARAAVAGRVGRRHTARTPTASPPPEEVRRDATATRDAAATRPGR